MKFIFKLFSAAKKSCETGWTRTPTANGELCMKIVKTETKKYSEAKVLCTLAAPKSAEIMKALNALNEVGTKADFWVGLDDGDSLDATAASEGTFTFSDGTSFSMTGTDWASPTWTSGAYTNFKSGQPSATNENARNLQDCVKIDQASGQWDEVSCKTAAFNYACEKAAE